MGFARGSMIRDVFQGDSDILFVGLGSMAAKFARVRLFLVVTYCSYTTWNLEVVHKLVAGIPQSRAFYF